MTPIDRISLADFSQPIDMTSEGPFVLYELEENPEFLLVNYSEAFDYQVAWYRYGYFQDENRDITAASETPFLDGAGTAMNVRPELYAAFLNGMTEQGIYLNGEETAIHNALLDAGLIVYTAGEGYSAGGNYLFLMFLTNLSPGELSRSAHHEYAHGYYVADEEYQHFAQSIWTGLAIHEENLLLKVLSLRYCERPADPSCCDVLADETFAYALAGPQLLLTEKLLTQEEIKEANVLFDELRTDAEQVLTLLRRE